MGLSNNRRVAFITGTSSGIGLHTSVELAKAGWAVVATVRQWDSRHALLREVEAAGVSDMVDCVCLDVTEHAEVERVVREVVERYGRIDVLINNAGFAAGGFTEEVGMDMWRMQMETNFFGLVAVTKAIIPVMRKQRHGTIVNMSSVSGRLGFPAYGPYAASKFAVEGFSESLRMELRPFGIDVVLIEPGAYQTKIWEKGFATMPAPVDSPYSQDREAIAAYTRRTADAASLPHDVVRTIVKVVTSTTPKLRYVVGKGPRLTLFLKSVLPWQTFERLILRILDKKA